MLKNPVYWVVYVCGLVVFGCIAAKYFSYSIEVYFVCCIAFMFFWQIISPIITTAYKKSKEANT